MTGFALCGLAMATTGHLIGDDHALQADGRAVLGDAETAEQAATRAKATLVSGDPLTARGQAANAMSPTFANELAGWLDRAVPDAAIRVQVGPDARFLDLATRFGSGAVYALPGTSHAAVLAHGGSRLRAFCDGPAASIVRDRYDLDGRLVQRSGLHCRATGGFAEAVMVSFADRAGGIAIIVTAADGDERARDFTARVVETIAAGEGYVVRLRAPALSS